MGAGQYGPVITLSDEDYFEAVKYGRMVTEICAKKQPNYTGLEAPGRYTVGYLGEFATARLFQQWWIKFKYGIHLTGKKAEPEFDVYSADSPDEAHEIVMSVDTKTRMNKNSSGMKTLEFQKPDADILVGARIIGLKKVEICGFVTAEEFNTKSKVITEYGVQYRVLPYSEMTRPIELVNLLISNREITRPGQPKPQPMYGRKWKGA